MAIECEIWMSMPLLAVWCKKIESYDYAGMSSYLPAVFIYSAVYESYMALSCSIICLNLDVMLLGVWQGAILLLRVKTDWSVDVQQSLKSTGHISHPVL